MEALFRGLNRICYILYRCRLYEVLLQSSQGSAQARQNLQLALTEFYTVILRFLAQAAHVYEKGSLQRAFAAFWSSDDIQALENQCRELETRAEIEAQNCDRSESSEARKLLLELPMMKDLTDQFLPRLLLFGKIYRKKKPERSLSGFLEFRTRIITRLFVKDAQPTLVDGYLSMDNIRSGNHLKSQQYYGCMAFVSHPRATEARGIQLTFTHQPAPARPSLFLESSTMSPIIGQTML